MNEFPENPLSGHPDVTRTYNKTPQQYQWQSTNPEYIKRCPVCQINKIPNQTIKEPKVITTSASKPFEKVFMTL